MNIRPITSTPKAVAFGADEETKTEIVRKTSSRTTQARLNQLLGLNREQVRFMELPPYCYKGYTALYFDHSTKVNNVLIPDDLGNSLIINYDDKYPSKKPNGVTIHSTSRKFTIYPADLAQKGISTKAEKVLQHLKQLIRSL